MGVSRKRQVFELIFVPSFAFLSSILSSLHLFVNGSTHTAYTNISASILFAILYQIFSLLLLYSVLNRRNQTLRDLGVAFAWEDILFGFVLAITILLFDYFIKWILIHTLPLHYLHYLRPNNIDFIPKQFSFLFFVFILLNPFTEELIVRGFIMREVFSLSQSRTLAVVVSVAFQTSYHLYQGLLPANILAVTFLIFSIYYIKTSRLFPIIVAHLILDLIAFISFLH